MICGHKSTHLQINPFLPLAVLSAPTFRYLKVRILILICGANWGCKFFRQNLYPPKRSIPFWKITPKYLLPFTVILVLWLNLSIRHLSKLQLPSRLPLEMEIYCIVPETCWFCLESKSVKARVWSGEISGPDYTFLGRNCIGVPRPIGAPWVTWHRGWIFHLFQPLSQIAKTISTCNPRFHEKLYRKTAIYLTSLEPVPAMSSEQDAEFHSRVVWYRI